MRNIDDLLSNSISDICINGYHKPVTIANGFFFVRLGSNHQKQFMLVNYVLDVKSTCAKNLML